MYHEIRNYALNSIKDALRTMEYHIPQDIKLEFPPNPKMGDLATAVSFQLAKELRISPIDITNKIMKKIEIPEIFEKVESKGSYINFFINYKIFSKKLLKKIDYMYGQLPQTNEKIILEHTSANPNGPLHIGHIRNAIIGDSLKRLLKTAGNEVNTQYYVNDMGRQLAMIVFGIKKLGLSTDKKLAELNNNSNNNFKNIDSKIDHQIGQLYFKVNKYINANEDMKTQVDELIKIYETNSDPNINKIFEKSVKDCLIGVKKTLTRLNVKHDDFIWESHFVRNGDVDKIMHELIVSGYTKEDEVLYLDLEDFGIDKELVLKRSNATSLYSTRDLAYHRWKSKKGDIVLDVLGSDHKLAIEQIGIALKLLHEKTPETIFYEFITLPQGSMSTRRGIFISVDELIEEAINRAKKELESRRTDLKKDEIAKISEEIGIGAIRYYISNLSPEKHITFKWDEALNFERGCASIQYAHARACNLLEKSGHCDLNTENLDINTDKIEKNWTPNEVETDLIRTIAKFPIVVEQSANIMRVHLIAQYTQELANTFNKFYKTEKVIGSEIESTRLLLVDKARITIKNSLELLGITAPIKM